MAILKQNNLGKLSGTSGEYIYRIRNGKVVQYKRPGNQQVSNSKAAKSARVSFAMNIKFAVFINSFPSIKLIWKKAKIKGTTHFQKIIKHNSLFTKNYGISIHNIITPPAIPLMVKSLLISMDKIRLNIVLDSEEIKNLINSKFILHFFFYLYEPRKKSYEQFSFRGFVNEYEENQINDIHQIEVKFDNEFRSYLIKYRKTIIYLAASSSYTNSKKIIWTSTYAKELNLI